MGRRSNGGERGSAEDRRRRRVWLMVTYAADAVPCPCGLPNCEIPVVDAVWPGLACRCYRCGTLLTVETVTVDRIIPGCKGGTYRRDNIRPACSHCNSVTGNMVKRELRAA